MGLRKKEKKIEMGKSEKKEEKSNKKNENKKGKAPKNTIQFLWILIIGIIKSIPKLLTKKILKLFILFLITLFLNMYLVIVKNEGFNPTPGNKWLDLTALKGNIAWATANWTIISFFLLNMFYRIREEGFKKVFVSLLGSPKLLFVKARESKENALPVFFITTAIVLIGTISIDNKIFLLLGGFLFFLSFTKNEKSMFIYFFALLRNDIKKIFRFKKDINQSSTYILVFSIFFGLVSAYFIEKALYIEIISVLLVVLAVLYKRKKAAAKVVSGFFMFLGINFIYLKLFGKVFADDVGWYESGGTIVGIIKSPGLLSVVQMESIPAIGSLAGILVATGLNELSSVINTVSDLYNDFTEGVDDIIDEVTEEVDEISDIMDDTVDGIADDILETYEDFLNSDIVKELGLDVEAIKEMFDSMVDDDKSIMDMIKDAFKPDESEGDKIVTTDDKWIADGLDKLFGTNEVMDTFEDIAKNLLDKAGNFKDFMKNMVKNSKNYEYISKLLQGNPDAKLGWLRRTFNELKNTAATKAGTYKNIFKGGLTVLSGIFDAVNNVFAGDEIAVAISKAVATSSALVAVGEAAPSLAAFELGNYVLFGGSDVANIASPSTMIKGAINFVADYGGGLDDKKFAERINSNYYGDNITNLYHATNMADDFIDNPRGFYDELCSFTDADSDGWKNMNQTVDKIFRLPDDATHNARNLYTTDGLNTIRDHPLDSVRRVATDIGHTAASAVVKVGEGWAYIGQGAGELSISVENGLASASDSVGRGLSSAGSWVKSWF
jgi:DNA-binding ferritin-like protein